MPGMDGVEATRRICEHWPEARVIILTTFDDDEYVFEGIRAGASGYLLKAIKGSELAQAIRTVAAGGSFMEPTVARKVMMEFGRIAGPHRQGNTGLPEPLAGVTQAAPQATAPDPAVGCRCFFCRRHLRRPWHRQRLRQRRAATPQCRPKRGGS